MYVKYYGLTRRPFENTPDPDFLFLSKNHREGLASLVYAINASKGFVLIVGDVGTGKTTLIHALIKELDPSFIILNVTNSRASFKDILYSLGKKVGITPERADPFGTAEAIQDKLETLHENDGTQAVLIVDEAHLLSDEALEDIRLISNIENEQRKLIQIVLVGQNELSEKLDQASLRSLKQRVVVARKLLPLGRKETYEYILHRLRVAGRQSQVFERKALSLIWNKTQGIPRLINQVCDNALLIGYAVEVRFIDQSIIKEVIRDMESVRRDRRPGPVFFSRRFGWIAGILVVAVLAVYFGLTHIDANGRFSISGNLRKDSDTSRGDTSTRPKNVAFGERRALLAKDSNLVGTKNSSQPEDAPSDAENELYAENLQAAELNRLEGKRESLNHESRRPKGGDDTVPGEIQDRSGIENFAEMTKESGNSRLPAVPFQTPRKKLPTEERQSSNSKQPLSTLASKNVTGESKGEITEKHDERGLLQQAADVHRPAVSSTPPEKPNNVQATKSDNRVKVRANECLFALARREYGFGNASIVDLIHAANPGIKDINRIYLGQEIILPEIKGKDLIVKDESGAYHIFYASFFREEDAKRCVQDLIREGKDASMISARQGDNLVYRVYLGTFKNSDDAERVLDTLDLKYFSFFGK